MQAEFTKLAAQTEAHPNSITRAQFAAALQACGNIQESDKQVLDRLFVLCDKTGDQLVNFKEFLMTMSILCRGSVEDKLKFSFQMYDCDETGEVTKDEMTRVFKGMNSAASYFGDTPMEEEMLNALVDDIFDEADEAATGTLNYIEYMHAVAAHPILVSFIGKAAAASDELCGTTEPAAEAKS